MCEHAGEVCDLMLAAVSWSSAYRNIAGHILVRPAML